MLLRLPAELVANSQRLSGGPTGGIVVSKAVTKGATVSGRYENVWSELTGANFDELSDERRHMYQVLELVDGLQRRAAADFEAALREINETTVASVPGAQYAGVTLVDSDGKVTSLAPTHAYPAWLDDVQRDVREGPCLSAAWSHHTIRIDDLATESRWPQYRDAALRRTPVRSILSFQLFGDAKNIRELNL